MNEVDSKVISSLRFPLAVMVVAIHSYFAIDGWSYYEVASQGLGSNVAQFFMIAIGHVMTHIAVPTFFLISGYLFFINFEDGGCSAWKRKMYGRVRTLIIPYLLWILLYILFSIALEYKVILYDGIDEWFKSHGGISMLWCSKTWNLDRVDLWGQPDIASSPILVPFWFMRDLLVCVAMTPFFYLLFKKSTPKYIKIVGVLILSFLYLTQTSLRIPGFTSLSFFYFGIGAGLSLWEKSLVDMTSKFKIPIWLLFCILLVVETFLNGHNTPMGNIIYPFYVFVGVWSILSLKPRKGGGLQHFTFFIFAFHIFILPFIGIVLSRLMCLITGESVANTISFSDKYPILVILEYCLKVISTVLISMGVYIIINKFCPKICKILCGR